MPTYVFKASWQATSKLISVEAPTEEKALAKAVKRKDIIGYWDLVMLYEKGKEG